MSALLDSLNPSQREAVSHVDGPLLMLSGPGSGKTRVVTHRIAYLIEHGVPPEQILALTFTNKAAEEMRSRLKRLVGDLPIWMGTFHGFCARFLRRYAGLAGLPQNFTIYDSDDAEAALKKAVQLAEIELTHLNLGSLAQQISRLKNRLVLASELEAKAVSSDEHVMARLYPSYQKLLLQSAAVDFDDLLLHVATILRQSPELRAELDARYRYILVDEYQDTNLAQYVIVRSLSVDYPNLSVTGDPDQSIYGWRGANIKNILSFEKDYPKVRVVRLEENYRSTPQILHAADYLIQHNENRKPKRLLPTRQSGNKVRLRMYASGKDEAQDIADQIARHCQEGTRKASDFAVLYRTNAYSRQIEQALRTRGIPFQMIGGFQFYQRREIKDLLSYLHLIHNPADDVAFSRVINTPPRGIGAKSLEEIAALATRNRCSMLDAVRHALDAKKLSARTLKSLKLFMEIYDQLMLQSRGPLVDLLRYLIDAIDYRKYLQSQNLDKADADVMANVDELLADAAELDADSDLGNELEIFLEQAALHSDTDRWESTVEKVTLMTLHAAKGLEFPHVFVIAVEQDVLPHFRSKDDPKQLEEERRLLFVGMTRAMDQLQLSCARSRSIRGDHKIVASSFFLMELPRSEIQIIEDFDSFDARDSWEDRNPFADDVWSSDGDTIDGSDDFDDEYSSLKRKPKKPSKTSYPLPNVTAKTGAAAKPSVAPKKDPQADSLDEYSQLPPDEPPQSNAAVVPNLLKTGADLLQEMAHRITNPDEYDVGRIVSHPQYGSGKIIAANGRSFARRVSVQFFQEASPRSFVLKHVPLSLES